MPNVTIEWVEGRDKKTKAEIARKIVEVLDQVAGVPPNSTNVLFLAMTQKNFSTVSRDIR